MIVFKQKDLTADERIEEAGLHEVELSKVFDIASGAGINFKVKTDDGYIGYIRLTLKKKSGEDNDYALNQLNELMILLNIDELELTGSRYLALENRKIGILVDIAEYEGYKNLQLISWFDIESEKTAYELRKNLEATHIDKMFAKLEQKYA
jgi:hypothetical protein